jgi:hypothetical protein
MSSDATPPDALPYRPFWLKFEIQPWNQMLRGLDLDERGVVISIGALQADQGGPLQLDDARLARACGASPARFARALNALIGAGVLVRDDGGLSVPLMQAAIGQAFALSASNASAARVRHEKANEKQRLKAASAEQPQSGRLAREMKKKEVEDIQKKTLDGDREKTALATNGPSAPEPLGESDLPSVTHDPPGPVAEAVAIYNRAAKRHGWPVSRHLTDKRRADVIARLAEIGGPTGWSDLIAMAETSDFICGRGPRKMLGFGLDWLCKATNLTKLIEGNYTDEHHPSPGRPYIADAADGSGLFGALRRQARAVD